MPLNSQTYLALKDYWHTRKGSKNTTLFLNRFDEPLGERGVQKMLRRYLKNAGIGQASIRTLRHTFGVHHLANGTNLKIVQEIMGLKDSRSTSVYVSLAGKLINPGIEDDVR